MVNIIADVKVGKNGELELPPKIKEKLKGLAGKTVKLTLEEKGEENIFSPLLELCGRAKAEIKNGSLRHDEYLYGRG